MNIIKHIPNKKKSKKHYYILRDGYFELNVKFDNMGVYCLLCKNPKMCDFKKCHHIYYILIYILKFTIYELTLLWKDDNWNNFIKNNKIYDNYEKEECGICLENIEKNGKINFDNIFQCLNCGCFYHYKCLKQLKEKHCLFCYSSFDNKLN